MNRADIAATLHAHLCKCSSHGYTQGSGRWGAGGYCTISVDGREYKLRQGDRDCSSSVIDAWQCALEGTAYEGALDGATYTGDMRRVFTASGLFEWKPMSFTAQRGDVYLNEVHHTAMCQSAVPDTLSEFNLNEKGTITGGKVGDQTGRESVIRAFYSFPWDGILHYNGKADDMDAKDIASAVWAQKIDGKKASDLLALNGSTTDPTGRGKKLNDHDHIKWIAAEVSEIKEGMAALDAKLDRLLEQ